MKKRFTEEQIIGVLKEAEADMKVAEVCSKSNSFISRSAIIPPHFQLSIFFRESAFFLGCASILNGNKHRC